MSARTTAPADFGRFVEALNRHAERLAKARAAERRGGDRRWRSPRLLWPDLAEES